MTIHKLLKLAGCFGVCLGISFGIGGIIITLSGWDPEPIAPMIASIVIGSVITFGGCLILALNEIGNKKPGD